MLSPFCLILLIGFGYLLFRFHIQRVIAMSEMSESSGSTETFARKLYRERSEWQDVTPEDFDQQSDDVLKISYTETFRDCFGYLRAVIKSGELSERVFEVSNVNF